MLCHPEPHPAVSYALRNAKSRFDVESAELGGGGPLRVSPKRTCL